MQKQITYTSNQDAYLKALEKLTEIQKEIDGFELQISNGTEKTAYAKCSAILVDNFSENPSKAIVALTLSIDFDKVTTK